jgi:chemotaxis protein methyltransferase CheR
MTAEDVILQDAARLLDARIGLKPELSFRPHLARALRDVSAAMNIVPKDLVASLSTDAVLFDALLNRITVQESGFFRHPEQFDVLASVLMPRMQPPYRAWSAACANGQEAYSLAMLMSESSGSGSVFASDVSPAALHRTTHGRYTQREMGGVSAARRDRHFVPSSDGWQARPNLRKMIKVQRYNLLDPIPPRVRTCQVVMCRNVLIYIKKRHAEMFLERLADAMDPDASLFVGGGETLWQMTDRFEPSQIGISYVYRPVARGSRRPTKAVVSAVPSGPAPSVSVVLETDQVDVPAAPLLDETGQSHGLCGRELLAGGSPELAIVAFRRWAYLAPDDPTAHFQLGSALAAVGQHVPALRAFRAAIAALDRCEPADLVAILHGYDASELRRLLDDRCRSAVGIVVEPHALAARR